MFGVNSEGEKFDFTLPTRNGLGSVFLNDQEDELIGKEIKDHWWIKAYLESGLYLTSRGRGRSIEYQKYSKSQLAELLNYSRY